MGKNNEMIVKDLASKTSQEGLFNQIVNDLIDMKEGNTLFMYVSFRRDHDEEDLSGVMACNARSIKDIDDLSDNIKIFAEESKSFSQLIMCGICKRYETNQNCKLKEKSLDCHINKP